MENLYIPDFHIIKRISISVLWIIKNVQLSESRSEGESCKQTYWRRLGI